MKHSAAVLSAALLVSIILAGCHAPQTDDPNADGLDNTDDDNLQDQPDPEIAAVRIISAPERAAAGTDVAICWEVDGRGTIAHTGLHHDNESHAGDVEPMVYDAGESFPDNETGDHGGGYDIPMTFCTSISMGEEVLYYRAHAMIDTPGVTSEERRIDPEDGA